MRATIRTLYLGVLLLLCACGGGGGAPAPDDAPEPLARRISAYEVAPPYVTEPGFWDRADLYVMRPDVLPLDRWPDEVLFPSDHGVRIVVLLPGDYRARSNGRLGDGVLYIEDSGTAAEPLLVIFAPSEGADLSAVPHPAERFGQSEALLTAIRIWNQTHQVFHGLTFANTISACLMMQTSYSVIDSCLWHETQFQPLRIRFDAHHNLVQRCVMRRFDRSQWGFNDTVAIQLSDGACTHNRIVSNVILNYTDAYQHTDRDGEDYGLGAGTIIDNNYMGFTPEAYVQDPQGELLCGENAIDMKMGGTEAEPVRITNNVFFGARATKAGCAASGSGGYAVTCHRRGTWIEFRGNTFVDNDAGIFLNAFFLDVDQAQGRIDPRLSITDNLFTGTRSRASAFPPRTGHVLTGSSPATFQRNRILDSDRLMEQEPPAPFELAIEDNVIHTPLVLEPRTRVALESNGNLFDDDGASVLTTLLIPWVGLTLTYRAPAAP